MPTLESLELTPQARPAAEAEIRRRAYLKWEQAGCPDGCDRRFWKEAELEWIEFCYVPPRHNGLSDDIDSNEARPFSVPSLTA